MNERMNSTNEALKLTSELVTCKLHERTYEGDARSERTKKSALLNESMNERIREQVSAV